MWNRLLSPLDFPANFLTSHKRQVIRAVFLNRSSDQGKYKRLYKSATRRKGIVPYSMKFLTQYCVLWNGVFQIKKGVFQIKGQCNRWGKKSHRNVIYFLFHANDKKSLHSIIKSAVNFIRQSPETTEASISERHCKGKG